MRTESTERNEELTWRMAQSCRQAFQRIGNPVRTALLQRWAGGQVLSLPRNGTISSNCQAGSIGRHNQDSWLWILPCLSTLVLASPQALQKYLQHQHVHSFVYSSLKHFLWGRKMLSLSMPWRHIAGWEVFIPPLFLNLGISWKSWKWVGFMTQPLHPWGKTPWYQLNRRQGGPLRQPGCFGEEKIFLSLTRIKP